MLSLKKTSARYTSTLSVVIPLAIGLALSVLAALWLHNSNQRQAQTALQQATEEKADAVARRVRLYQYGLRGARGTIVTLSEHGISRRLFSAYSQTRDIDQEFTGALGFGFIRRVRPADEATFVQQARNDDKPDFNIRQLAPHSGERYVIQYMEPEARNLAAIGLDIASEQNRREAAFNALKPAPFNCLGLSPWSRPAASRCSLFLFFCRSTAPARPLKQRLSGCNKASVGATPPCSQNKCSAACRSAPQM